MRVLLWHVHGSWTTSFVHGPHSVFVPLTPDRGPDGRGRARTYAWPERVTEVPVERLGDLDVDVVVLQRPHEIELCREWLGRRPGRDLPAVYVEHNTPGGGAVTTRHPLADRDDILLVHVTHANRLFWDSGRAPTTVIDHGIVDPGYRFSGEIPHAGVVINEPVRRGRAVGTDLLPELAAAAPLDVFGIDADRLGSAMPFPPDRLRTFPDVSQDRLHAELARRRLYVHTHRWTSLGLSLIEAMHLGMPVVALATTEAPSAVPPEAGCVSADLDRVTAAVREYLGDLDAARAAGRAARAAASNRFGLDRFLADWDVVLTSVSRSFRPGTLQVT